LPLPSRSRAGEGPRRAAVARYAGRALEIGRKLGDVWLVTKALHALALDSLGWGDPIAAPRIWRQLLQLSDCATSASS
jgi:hypothetical protein